MTDPTSTNTITPLPSNQKIVNADGTPTLFFQRWAQERSIDLSGTVTYAQAQQLVADAIGSFEASRSILTEAGQLVGGGDLTADRTLGLADTGVTPGTYGDASNSAQITIDEFGRVTEATEVPISGGGGGSGLTLIEEIDLAGLSSFSFNSIPQTYRHLDIKGLVRGTDSNAGALSMYVNGDTGNNYSWQRTFANLTGPNASQSLNTSGFFLSEVPGSYAPTGAANDFQHEILYYSQNAFRKNMRGRWNNTWNNSNQNSFYIIEMGGYWANVAAITDILVNLSAGTFVAGSKVGLYGID